MPLALITGANRGLGLEASRQLLKRGWEVVLTGRDEEALREAALELGGDQKIRSVVLDVEAPSAIERLDRELPKELRLNALINNAAVSLQGFGTEVARRTLDVNYRGPLRVTEALIGRLTPGANVVMVSSGMGDLGNFAPRLRKRLSDPELDRVALEQIATEFVASVAVGDYAKLGFPGNAYSVSKALLNAVTRVLAPELRARGCRVNAVCPGWVRTRMGGAAAPRTVERGASVIVWAATLDEGGPSGGFFRDEKPIPW